MNRAVIRLSPADNVAVCCRPVTMGETILVDGISLIALETIDIGHKIAISPLKIGENIIKYGMSIGSATQDIAAGGWVHVHNMQSDYIPAHLRDATGAQR
jgi:hypothetical protein